MCCLIFYQVNTFRYGLPGRGGGIDSHLAGFSGFSYLVMLMVIVLLGACSLHLLKTGRGLRS